MSLRLLAIFYFLLFQRACVLRLHPTVCAPARSSENIYQLLDTICLRRIYVPEPRQKRSFVSSGEDLNKIKIEGNQEAWLIVLRLPPTLYISYIIRVRSPGVAIS